MDSQGIFNTDEYHTDEYHTDKYHTDEYGTDEYGTDGYDTSEYDTEEDNTDEYHTDSESMTSGRSRPRESLDESLARNEEKSVFDHSKEFLPYGTIDGIITHERVCGRLKSRRGHPSTETQESRQADQASVEKLADSILRSSKKTFAITLYANLSNKDFREAMIQFHSLGFNDDNLPVTGDATTRIFFSSSTKRYRRPWNHFRVDAFCSNQWRFLAPVFDSKQSELALHTNHILPFTWSMQRGAGMFGEVHEVTIHPAHGRNVDHVRHLSRCQISCSQRLLTCASIFVRIPMLQSKDCSAPTPKTGTRGRSSKMHGAKKSKHTKRLPSVAIPTLFDSSQPSPESMTAISCSNGQMEGTCASSGSTTTIALPEPWSKTSCYSFADWLMHWSRYIQKAFGMVI